MAVSRWQGPSGVATMTRPRRGRGIIDTCRGAEGRIRRKTIGVVGGPVMGRMNSNDANWERMPLMFDQASERAADVSKSDKSDFQNSIVSIRELSSDSSVAFFFRNSPMRSRTRQSAIHAAAGARRSVPAPAAPSPSQAVDVLAKPFLIAVQVARLHLGGVIAPSSPDLALELANCSRLFRVRRSSFFAGSLPERRVRFVTANTFSRIRFRRQGIFPVAPAPISLKTIADVVSAGSRHQLVVGGGSDAPR